MKDTVTFLRMESLEELRMRTKLFLPNYLKSQEYFVYRKPSERNANPDRLNLDKRDLTHMPLLEGEERLRLLNLQHNHV